MSFAKTLVFLKVDKFKIVNILGFNAPPWMISTIGSMMAGCIGAGIYMTNAPEACHYITEHSKAEVVSIHCTLPLPPLPLPPLPLPLPPPPPPLLPPPMH
jgi:long-subunit acyl-CoA synthetase (AMP-forming)